MRVSFRSYPNRTAGVTLVDVVITVTIMAILSAVAGPRFSRTLQRLRVESAAERLVADLALARQRAVAGSTSQSVEFIAGTDQYRLVGMDDLDHGGGDYTVDLEKSPYLATVISANFGGDGVVNFDNYGQADSDGLVVLDVAGQQLRVVVDGDTGKAVIP